MKKLLTILVVALTLCLLCGAALADSETYNAKYIEPEFLALTKIKVGGVDYTITLPGDSNLAAVQATAGHAEEKTVKVFYDGDKFVDVQVVVNYHQFGWTDVKPATCLVDGSETDYCKICGKAYQTRVLDHRAVAKQHKEVDKVWETRTYKDSTCSAEGTAMQWCKTCKVWISGTEASIKPKDTHSYSVRTYIAPTCVADGIYEDYCVSCGVSRNEIENHKRGDKNYFAYTLTAAKYQDETDPLYALLNPEGESAHDWSNWVDGHEATCFEGATRIRWCRICLVSEEKLKPGATALDPIWIINPKKTYSCNYAGTVELVCSICGGKAPSHKSTADGIDGQGNVKKDEKIVGKLQHEYELSGAYLHKDAYGDKVIIPATCITPAYYEYYCKNDKTHDTYKVKVSDALGHDWTEWQVVVAPGQNGNPDGIWNRICKRCGKDDRFFGTQQPASACKTHEPIVDEENSVEPTCTEAGKTAYKCKNCGTELESKEIPALGHEWIETVTKAATCKEEGLKNRVCKRCNAGELDVKIEKTAHTFGEWTVTKPATKEEKGEETRTCSVCGEKETRPVDYVVTAAPKYTMTGVKYNGTAVTGKLVHDEDTLEAPAKYVRVTFYIEGNYYMAANAEVEADGSFTVEGVGPIVYITVVANGSSSVKPDDVKPIAPAEEIYVK
jgi:hypothetical protein